MLSGKRIGTQLINIQDQLASIDKLGVDVVLHSYNLNIPEDKRKSVLEKCKKTFNLKVMQERILSPNKTLPCAIKLMEYLLRGPRKANTQVVSGPEPEYFLIKVALAVINKMNNLSIPDQIRIFPKMVTDENGLRFRSHYPPMDEEHNKILKTIPKEIDKARKEFVLVITLNWSRN